MQPPRRSPATRSQLHLVGTAEIDRVAVCGLDPLRPGAIVVAGAQLDRAHFAGEPDEVETLGRDDRAGAEAARALVAMLGRNSPCDGLSARQRLLEVDRGGHVGLRRKRWGRDPAEGAGNRQQAQFFASLQHCFSQHTRSLMDSP
jgi:hypothetical protein